MTTDEGIGTGLRLPDQTLDERLAELDYSDDEYLDDTLACLVTMLGELDIHCFTCHTTKHIKVRVVIACKKVSVACTRCGRDIVAELRDKCPILKKAPLIHIPLFTANGAVLEQIEDIAEQLVQMEKPDHTIFRFGGDELSTVMSDGTVTAISTTALRIRIAAQGTYTVGTKVTDPTVGMVVALKEAARDLVRIPELQRVVTVPVLMEDGRVLTKPGYDKNSLTYYAPTVPGVDVPVLGEITSGDVAGAVTLIRDDLLGDFPFRDEASRANAIAATVQPFVRSVIARPAPMFAVNATIQGTGKTLAASLIMTPGCGAVEPMKFATSETEQAKLLLAKLYTGPSGILFDNVTGYIESTALAEILTSPTGFWDGRQLGHSKILTVPVQQLWMMTGNGVILGADLLRRVIWIDLDAEMEEPNLRTGPRPGTVWRHEDITASGRREPSRPGTGLPDPGAVVDPGGFTQTPHCRWRRAGDL